MVRRAVRELVSQYETGTHLGGFVNCPLCNLFEADWDSNHERVCANCPNAAFYTDEYDIPPCSTRTRTFPALDWSSGFNDEGGDLTPEEIVEIDKRIIIFWKRVLPVLPTGYKTEFIMTDERKKAIYNIAKQMQDESDKCRDEICCSETD